MGSTKFVHEPGSSIQQTFYNNGYKDGPIHGTQTNTNSKYAETFYHESVGLSPTGFGEKPNLNMDAFNTKLNPGH